MGLTKQAKTLSGRQTVHLQAFLQRTRYPVRNRVILLLSVKAGLRAKEIAALTWDMLTDAEGKLGSAIHLRNEASKGRSGRVIPLNRDPSGRRCRNSTRHAELVPTSSPQSDRREHLRR